MRTAISLVVCCLASFSPALPTNPSSGPVAPQDIVFLGIADNRIFYAEVTATRDWAQAKQRCEESNLKLASITSPNQVSTIEAGLVKANITTTDFWISGRETRDFTRFLVWDNEFETDAQPVDQSVFNETHNNYGGLIDGSFVYCTDFHRPHYLDLEPCNKRITGVLCFDMIH